MSDSEPIYPQYDENNEANKPPVVDAPPQDDPQGDVLEESPEPSGDDSSEEESDASADYEVKTVGPDEEPDENGFVGVSPEYRNFGSHHYSPKPSAHPGAPTEPDTDEEG